MEGSNIGILGVVRYFLLQATVQEDLFFAFAYILNEGYALCCQSAV
jgi:hypothetical protein